MLLFGIATKKCCYFGKHQKTDVILNTFVIFVIQSRVVSKKFDANIHKKNERTKKFADFLSFLSVFSLKTDELVYFFHFL